MRNRKLLYGILAALGMLAILYDEKTAFLGASKGIALCIKSVIPALFPFLFLSGILVNSLYGDSHRLLVPIGRVFHMPQGSEPILIPAFLGGYPVGAKTVFDAYSDGVLSAQCAQRLLSFCSNAGPSFLFGILSFQFSNKWYVWKLWGIQLLSIYTVSRMIPHSENAGKERHNNNEISMHPMETSLSAMAKICGWIVLFRVLLSFFDHWFLDNAPVAVKVILSGCLELTNGCLILNQIPNESIRFIVCSGMLSFGGLCVVEQTKSVSGKLGIRYYLIGKAAQTLFSLLYASAAAYGYFFCIPIAVLIVVFLTPEKKSRNLRAAVV